jgi:hypothetical protein
MKNIFLKSIILLSALFLVPACTDEFEEINTNPNAPTEVNAALLLPQIQRDVMGNLLSETWGIGNLVVQHTAKNQFVNEDRYLWGERNAIWNGVYDNYNDLQTILQQSEINKQSNYRGVALVMKSWMFSLVTDAYGDVPYSEAGRAKEGIIYPKYDTQESIYNGILADLKTANDILGTSTEAVEGDVIFNGDVNKWKRLANSLRIRYLMRISKKRDVKADLAAIVNDTTKNPLFRGVADNAVYTFLANAPDQFPLHTSRTGSFNEIRASKTLADTLAKYGDPRLQIFFRPTPATIAAPTPAYVGIPNGLNDVDALQFNGGPQNQSTVGTLYFEQAVSAQGLNIAKGVMMTYAELQFLLAEAAEKGLITGDPAKFYTDGVRASFAFYGLTAAAANTYLGQAGVAYTGSQTEKLNKIGVQKWISLFFQGLEAWFDWRRTGIPNIKPGPSNQNMNMIPVRFIYPIIEQGLNGENRAAAVAAQGADNINTKVWSLK